ncbi:hypothetical protein LWI28_001934 [Acer negundo]|uniref:Uncharacterized protein n=1 Tax=Acer negundo TaxID=4023 RepID=A0AAD5JFZ2_ACENE|nr:hypothetical protein LWI28_001934 [Acer negundo]
MTSPRFLLENVPGSSRHQCGFKPAMANPQYLLVLSTTLKCRFIPAHLENLEENYDSLVKNEEIDQCGIDVEEPGSAIFDSKSASLKMMGDLTSSLS